MINRQTHIIARFLLVFTIFAAAFALAVGTQAGEEITNQATVKYIDSSNNPQTTNSNQVITVVKQIYSLSLVTDGTVAAPGQFQDVTPGSIVYYPYTLTNTGNGSDSFTLTTTVDSDATLDNGGIAGVVYYWDSNGDGVVQTGEPAITSVDDLPADESVKLIMSYQIPAAADTDDVVVATPVATSQGGPTQIDNLNYHQTTVVQNAVIVSSKLVDASTATPGSTLQYTITATNTGSQNATNVVITDAAPAGTTISGTATSVPAGNATTAGNDVSATFATVVPGQVVKLIFSVTVDASTAPGNIENVASTTYIKVGGDPANPTTVTTNTTSTEVLASYAIAVGPRNFPEADAATATTYTSDEGYTVNIAVNADEQTVASANAGDSVSFINSVLNNGTDTDAFNLSQTVSGLPAGSAVLFKRLDGSALADTDGDGQPDSGPLDPGEEFDFVVQVVLAQTAVTTDTDVVVTVTATSSNEPSQTDTSTDTVLAIVGSSVLLGNSDGLAGSVDTNPVDQAVNPGAPAVFPMDVVNEGSNPDSFNLSGSTTLTTTTGGTVTVPVAYYPAAADTDNDGTLSSTEIANASPIANTGTIAGGAEVQVFAVVNVPANVVGQTSTINQAVTSPLSATTASFNVDTLTVNAVKTFTFSPNRNGTAPSPGTVIYRHNISNTGNMEISNLTVTEVTSGNVAGWSYLYSYDSVTFYPAASLPATTIAPASNQVLFVQVSVPAGVPQNATNVLSVTVAPTFSGDVATTGSATVSDTTIVVGGEINVVKEWSLDGINWYKGDGTDTGTVPQVAPLETIRYRMTLTNIGTADITAVEVFDTVPTFTDFVQGSQDAGTGNTEQCSTDGGTSYAACPAGTAVDPTVDGLKFTISSLAPGASVQVLFIVQVQ